MASNKSDKKELLDKLNELLKKQSQFQQEISDLEKRILSFSPTQTQKRVKPETEKIIESESLTKEKKEPKEVHPYLVERNTKSGKPELGKKINDFISDWEKFIGENLISKIGIAVLIIGVGIGTKYAIDNDLISPLVRIILGYLVGFILNFFAIRLKKRFHNFSAVLASGGMAIHYFITYAAYIYYGFYTHNVAFILMVVITVLTVWLALFYNRQVITHFGMAGAYIIPFLLAEPDSSILVLLTYMSIINCGILFISTKKQWKPLNYLALISTWIIFMSWFSSKNYDNEFGLSLAFSSIFFVLFYLVFLSYKLILKEKFKIDDIIFLLLNSGMFYLIGMITLEIANLGKEYAGLFTFINAVIHAFTAFLVYRLEQKDKNLFYWTVGLVITFFTIAIPIQFNNAVTGIFWSAEAAGLFWFSRRVQIRFYEIISLVMVLGVLGVIVTNWSSVMYNFYFGRIEIIIKPMVNPEFFSSVCTTIFLLFIFLLNRQNRNEKGILKNDKGIRVIFSIFLLFILYFTFYSQINLYWDNVQVQSAFERNSDNIWIQQYDQLNNDVFSMKSIWLINYSMLFTFALSLVNIKWLKDSALNGFLLVAHFILILIFLTGSLNILTELRESYLDPTVNTNYDASILHILVRYVAYIFFALLMFSLYHYVNPGFTQKVIKKTLDVTFIVSLVWVLSSELINWLSLSGSTELYKHGLSILWGVFSLLIIVYGIWKKKKHLRITALTLLGITLLKMFFYDLSNLTTVQKTFVFVLIGALLLVVSFMYNKYRNLISGND